MPDNIRPLLGLREPVSSLTHAAACLWALFGTALLWRLCRGDRPRQWTMACFGGSMVLLYAASALYHAMPLPPEDLHAFKMIDHTAIFLLIAGTYTPVLFVPLRDRRRKRALIIGVWTLATAGIACKWSIPNPPYGLTVGLYLGLGWIGMLPIVELSQAVGWRGMRWALYGGIAYTLGGVIDLIEWPVPMPQVFGHHELFHVLVIVGTFCHFVFIFQHLVRYPREARARLPAKTG